MRTPVCDLLGVELPIVAFSHCRDVVAAVTRAGGMGVLGAVAFSPRQLEVELSWIDEEVGGRPYGIDVLLPASRAGVEQPGVSPASLAALIPPGHRDFVDELMARYGVPPLPPGSPRPEGMLDVSPEGVRHLLDVAFAHRPRLVASALGPAPDFLVAEAHARDVLVAGLVGSRRHAERQQAAGVDLIVAQGCEAGGHTGEIGTMVLVPEVVDAVAPTPVLAAGGIANGRQVAAALALGAQGVWCGSVWLTTHEAETHPVVREKMLRATSSDTVRSRATTGKPARQLRTAWTEEWDDPAHPDPLPMPLQTMLTAAAQSRVARGAATPGSGAEQLITYFVGQVVGSMNRVRPAAAVIHDMVEEYLAAAARLAATLDG